MINAEEIRKTIEQKLDSTDKFVVEVKVKPGNNITVLLDSDTSISIDDCIAVNRHIESVYDRETEDYNLVVSSSGLDQPYKMLRQYVKNIGRDVEVSLLDKSVFTGKLVAADESGITVYRKTKVKKVETEESRKISFSEIKQTKEIISFK
ncbi:MAG: ribosome assembly cofactor RimP [Bacteroidales bacterium]|nr:ribosome assembly cofactor RimP [Bacteroidales bacterium]